MWLLADDAAMVVRRCSAAVEAGRGYRRDQGSIPCPHGLSGVIVLCRSARTISYARTVHGASLPSAMEPAEWLRRLLDQFGGTSRRDDVGGAARRAGGGDGRRSALGRRRAAAALALFPNETLAAWLARTPLAQNYATPFLGLDSTTCGGTTTRPRAAAAVAARACGCARDCARCWRVRRRSLFGGRFGAVTTRVPDALRHDVSNRSF
jgi:hypothetical protein